MFMRFQYDTFSLKKMREKSTKEHGLCCYKYNKDIHTPFIDMTVDKGEKGEIVIFEGKIRSLCPEGYKVHPSRIIERIPVTCKRISKYKYLIEV